LIEKILKENNISLANVIDSDEKRCLTSNEKLNKFFFMNLNFDEILNNEKDNNILLINDKNDFSEIALSDLKSEENLYLENVNNQENKIPNNENSNYLINSNLSNNLQISSNTYLRNLNSNKKKINQNYEFLKDNSIANLLFSNENINLKDNEKTNEVNYPNTVINSMMKNKLE
jgi:hypothetical protein